MRVSSHSEALVFRAAMGFAEAKRQMARMLGRLYVIEEEGGVAFISMGLNHARFNPVMVVGPPRDAMGVIEKARAFYGRLKKPWELTVLGDWAPEMNEAAKVSGLEQVALNPGLLLAPLVPRLEGAPGDLEVRRVRDGDALYEHNGVIACGFGIDRSVTAAFDDAESLKALDMERYTGYVGNTAVVTALRVSALRIASVFNVVTIPEYRKRGYGDWLTRLCAHESLSEGCVANFLESTVAGYSMYLKMGYEHVFDFYCWREKA